MDLQLLREHSMSDPNFASALESELLPDKTGAASELFSALYATEHDAH